MVSKINYFKYYLIFIIDTIFQIISNTEYEMRKIRL